ncbi:hypothetical protein M885DRAFT_618890 [Pelagophyceae sp. CCMP2097]|nr:hypothetical protein M885DRAFT_618890 [Pelagophyceae sp. CCMP2097]
MAACRLLVLALVAAPAWALAGKKAAPSGFAKAPAGKSKAGAGFSAAPTAARAPAAPQSPLAPSQGISPQGVSEAKNPQFMGSFMINDETVVDDLVALFEATPQVRGMISTAATGQPVVDTAVKDSLECSFAPNDPRPAWRNYLRALKECAAAYVAEYPYAGAYGVWSLNSRTNLQLYPPGGGYKTFHTERTGAGEPEGSRHLVFMTYLNDVTDAGGTEFYHQGLIVQPKKGLTLIWPADWTFTHRGVASQTQQKLIATGCIGDAWARPGCRGEALQGHIGEEFGVWRRGADVESPARYADVTLANVEVGLRVVRGRHWRTGKYAWKDDRHGLGTILGLTDFHGRLHGANAATPHAYDRFHFKIPGVATQGPRWCTVRWDATDKESIYPIGATGPLGKWWWDPEGEEHAQPCFSLRANSHDLQGKP